MNKSFFLKYKFHFIYSILFILGVIFFGLSNIIELGLIIGSLVLVIYILGIRGFLVGMNILISLFIPAIILYNLEVRGYRFIFLFLILFIITSIILTILLKVYDKNYTFKLEDFYNPVLALFGLFKLGVWGVFSFVPFILILISFGYLYNIFFGVKFNGNYCAKIIIIDPRNIEEKREFPKRINIDIKDNKLVGYHFKDILTKEDSILLNEYNLFNREEVNSNQFHNDSVCEWFSKNQKNIVGIKIRYEGYCDN